MNLSVLQNAEGGISINHKEEKCEWCTSHSGQHFWDHRDAIGNELKLRGHRYIFILMLRVNEELFVLRMPRADACTVVLTLSQRGVLEAHLRLWD